MRKGAKVAWAVVLGLVCLSAVIVVIARGSSEKHASQKLKFLSGVRPVSVRMEEMNTLASTKSGLVSQKTAMTVEVFELRKSFDEVLGLALLENSEVSVLEASGDAPLLLAPASSVKPPVIASLKRLGPDRTQVEIIEEQPQDPIRRFFAWVRRATGGS